MTVQSRIALAGVSLALGVTPALALAAGHPHGRPTGVSTGVPAGVTTGRPTGTPPSNPGTSHRPSSPGSQGAGHRNQTPGPKAGLPAKAKAYGRYCQAESRRHVAGQPGTPFSNCVTAMAKLATGDSHNPTAACKSESKRHVAGQPGTPYSLCVSGAAKLLHSSSQTTSGS